MSTRLSILTIALAVITGGIAAVQTVSASSYEYYGYGYSYYPPPLQPHELRPRFYRWYSGGPIQRHHYGPEQSPYPYVAPFRGHYYVHDPRRPVYDPYEQQRLYRFHSAPGRSFDRDFLTGRIGARPPSTPPPPTPPPPPP